MAPVNADVKPKASHAPPPSPKHPSSTSHCISCNKQKARHVKQLHPVALPPRLPTTSTPIREDDIFALQYIESYYHATCADCKRVARLRPVAATGAQERVATGPWSVEKGEAVICRLFYCLSQKCRCIAVGGPITTFPSPIRVFCCREKLAESGP